MNRDEIHDLKLNRQLFLKYADFIKNKSGLFFDLSKMYFLETRLKKRMKERNIKDFVSYFHLLQTDYTNSEFRQLLNEITIHETSFFRIHTQFEALKDLVIPELILKPSSGHQNYLTFLSGGCSTGEEAYSIAMSFLEKAKKIGKVPDFSVLGIDLSEDAIEKARTSIYPEEKVKALSPQRVEAFFEKYKGNYRVKQFIRDRVMFKYGNIVNAETIPLKSFNVIFCRYVLIYLGEEAKKKVIKNIYSMLKPGGYLFVAPSESYNIGFEFERVDYKGITIFKKPL